MNFYSIKEKTIFFTIPSILFSLLPFFLITGPFLSDFVISLIGLLFLIYCVRTKNFVFFKNKFFYFFLLFWIYLVLNSLLNNFNLSSFKISFFYIRYGLFVVSIATLFEFDNKFIKIFFYSIFFCFVGLIFDGFYQYFSGENIFGFKSPNPTRVSSFFHDELILGSYLSRLWPLFFALSILFINKKSKFYVLFITSFILSEVLIFLSGDRTAFFYINLSAIFVIIFSQKLLKLRLFILITSLFLLFLISFINPTAKERIIDKTIAQMNLEKNLNKDEKIYIFSKQHNSHYISAYRMFLDNKFFGVGIKNFRNFCNDPKYKENKYSCSSHPHNTYIQVLSEIGIFGFAFLILILFYFLKKIIEHSKYKLKGKYFFNDFQICLLSALLIYLWPFVPTGNLFNNWLNIILILNLPFFIWNRKLNKTI